MGAEVAVFLVFWIAVFLISVGWGVCRLSEDNSEEPVGAESVKLAGRKTDSLAASRKRDLADAEVEFRVEEERRRHTGRHSETAAQPCKQGGDGSSPSAGSMYNEPPEPYAKGYPCNTQLRQDWVYDGERWILVGRSINVVRGPYQIGAHGAHHYW